MTPDHFPPSRKPAIQHVTCREFQFWQPCGKPRSLPAGQRRQRLWRHKGQKACKSAKIGPPRSLQPLSQQAQYRSWGGFGVGFLVWQKTVNKKFLAWTDNKVTYPAVWFVGRSLAWGLLIARSRSSWNCVISLLCGLTPVRSGGNSRNGAWLRLNVIPLDCIPLTGWSLLAWPPALGVWLDRCPCPCWWLIVNTWWDGVGILAVAMTSRIKKV